MDDRTISQTTTVMTCTDDWTRLLTREQFDAMFSADLDAPDDDFGDFEPASNAVVMDIASRDVACSRRTTSAYNEIYHVR